MNNLELFIKMCDCPEIQGLLPRSTRHKAWCNPPDIIDDNMKWDGNYIYDPADKDDEDNGVSLYCSGCDSEYGGCGLTPSIIWLPRQDQLQGMVDKGASAYGQLERFSSFIKENLLLQSNRYSWEQLWLIYVMRWEYNKVWTEGGWVPC